jgi:hypothetical protein
MYLVLKVDNDRPLLMALKYAKRTAYCIGRGFPVLKIQNEWRVKANQALIDFRPKKMMYSLYFFIDLVL